MFTVCAEAMGGTDKWALYTDVPYSVRVCMEGGDNMAPARQVRWRIKDAESGDVHMFVRYEPELRREVAE